MSNNKTNLDFSELENYNDTSQVCSLVLKQESLAEKIERIESYIEEETEDVFGHLADKIHDLSETETS